MSDPDNGLVKQLRQLLDRLHRSRHLSNDEREVVWDEVAAEARKLQMSGIVDALDKAVGSNPDRQENAIFLLGEWTDLPEVVDRIDSLLLTSNSDERFYLLSVIGRSRLTKLGPRLRRVIEEESDSQCLDMAIHAASKLKSQECLPIILRIADDGDPKLSWRIATALASYATEECRYHLNKLFGDVTKEKSTRIFAAWGLAKLGDQNALNYLIAMLDDPDDKGPNYSYPGQSLRAAQALCDVFNWPFDSRKPYVAKVKEMVELRRTTVGDN